MNDVIKVMCDRRSVRAYRQDEVPRELIEQVIETGLWAPSGMGRQSPIILAITDRALRDTLAAANAKVMGVEADPFYGAPVVLVVLAPRDVPTHVYDGSLVMGNLMLAASTVGLGSCWIHRAKETFELPEFKQVLSELGVDGDYEGIGNCILGWPAEEPEPKPRRDGRVVWAS